MKLGVIVWFLGIVHDFVRFLERQKWKAEGRNEVLKETDEERLNRIALADAARADADSINGMHNDPYNRDNR